MNSAVCSPAMAMTTDSTSPTGSPATACSAAAPIAATAAGMPAGGGIPAAGPAVAEDLTGRIDRHGPGAGPAGIDGDKHSVSLRSGGCWRRGAYSTVRQIFSADPERAILILTEARAAVTREHAPAVGDRIRAMLPDMPLAMARVADYLLHNPQAPMTLSIGELAEQAGTSPATVTRFCRMLGYSGYVELRVSIATDVGRGTCRLDSWATEIGRGFGPDDSPEDLLRMLIGGHTRTLREATSAIDLAVMTEVSRRIAVSAQVDIYGVGGSAMLAEELQGRLYRIGIRAYAWSEVHIGLTSAAIQDADTVAIGISTTGRTEETIQMLAEAGRAGALTVAITNNPASPLAELADLTIVTSVHEQFLQPDDLSAKHGQLLVLDLLYLLVAQQNFDRSSAKLAASARAVASHRRPRRTRRTARGSDIMTTVPSTSTLAADFAGEVRTRLDRLAALAADGGLDEAIDLLTEADPGRRGDPRVRHRALGVVRHGDRRPGRRTDPHHQDRAARPRAARQTTSWTPSAGRAWNAARPSPRTSGPSPPSTPATSSSSRPTPGSTARSSASPCWPSSTDTR